MEKPRWFEQDVLYFVASRKGCKDVGNKDIPQHVEKVAVVFAWKKA